ncbi:hypothetical protein [Paraflavitalea sp. CAU 1676]|uniref:hypothetical protein n=1 Tax=Paraflavitalea sp. CAU 1676 TaxID=3032598 RepID=UPI0023DBAD56|nr:hypothetical protein [Paraflavitalea sp. CAU 1676]MDF2187609.1 hypothetical protein [Paraflavitalea sp. CAU 1676]
MKTILTFLMPLIAIVSGIFSFTMFSEQYHYMSAILTVVAYLSASAWVYLLTTRTKVAYH